MTKENIIYFNTFYFYIFYWDFNLFLHYIFTLRKNFQEKNQFFFPKFVKLFFYSFSHFRKKINVTRFTHFKTVINIYNVPYSE